MKFFLVRDGKKTPFKANPEDTSVSFPEACPHCGVIPMRVTGIGQRIAEDDHAYEADGVCVKCQQHIGTIRGEVNTLFGVREDEAVFSMGVKIY